MSASLGRSTRGSRVVALEVETSGGKPWEQKCRETANHFQHSTGTVKSVAALTTAGRPAGVGSAGETLNSTS